MTKLVAAAGGLGLALSVGAGIGSAAPDNIVNTTCTYPQIVAALNAQSPDTAKRFTTNGLATVWLQGFLGAPPDQRQQMVDQAQGIPAVQQNTRLINQVASTCNNY